MAGLQWPHCLDWCKRHIAVIEASMSEYPLSPDSWESLRIRLEVVYRELACLDLLGDFDDNESQALQLIGEALALLESRMNCRHGTQELSLYNAPVLYDGTIGRPRYDLGYDIHREQLEFLLSKKFSVTAVAALLNVSVRTVRRRMEDNGLYVRSLYSTLSNDELDSVVISIQSRFGLCGNRQMMGHLFALGITVQQERVRESQRRVDPGGCAMRRMVAINRRKYRVNGPLALWHIDGNHKLVR
uniref:Uncharacterized protein n=1 Tax=Amphimedon queenslandica TaxID=400682 RepID=A0A1X7SGX3_AMPQE